MAPVAPAPVLRLLLLLLLLVVVIQSAPATGIPLSGQQRPKEKLCDAGFYLSEKDKNCLPCVAGVDYTNHTNSLPNCRLCSVCKEDQEEKRACTTTSDTVCQCKPGTFRTPEAPEICQRCRPRCTEGEDEIPCTPWSDRKCVPKTTGGARVPEEPVTPTTEAPSSSCLLTVSIGIGILIVIVIVIVILWFVIWKHRKKVSHCMKGHASDHISCTTGHCEIQDNNHNEAVSSPPLQSSLETNADEQSPEEARCLLERPSKKRLLVPVDGEDPTETLKLFFPYFPTVIPWKCWEKLMRLMGLSDNDISLIRARAPDDALYEMLLKWLQKTGRRASINQLLDALETLEERCARDKIEDHVVHSGKFIYQDDLAGSA